MDTSGKNEELENEFPGLRMSPYEIELEYNPEYNCIAWAAGDTGRWWEPDAEEVEYWPPGIAREYSVESYVAAFLSIGYVACDDGNHEPGFEKVAVYALWGEPTHASRQLLDGRWSSKIGKHERITHAIDALDGDVYGFVVVFLKRPVK